MEVNFLSSRLVSPVIITDSRHSPKVPESWTDTHAAALKDFGVGHNMSIVMGPTGSKLNLTRLPSKPINRRIPVLVHGETKATGLMAARLLNL
jgi:hypothetical protein